MTNLKDITKKTNLRNDSIKPIIGVPNSVDEQIVARGIASLTLPKSDESIESVIPEKINASHLFVVAGQECICVTDTIAEKARERSKPR